MPKSSRKLLRSFAAVASCVVLVFSAAAVADAKLRVYYPVLQPAQESQAPKASGDELKAAQKVEAGADAAARQQAAGEFLKKYPKSPLRLQVAQLVVQKISEVQDGAQQLALGENFANIFNEPAEADLIQPIIIYAYAKTNRYPDAFRVGSTYLARNPEAVDVLMQLAFIGIEQARTGNAQFVEPSRQYGLKALELIETDKKPVNFDAARWAEYKTKWLPQLYQSLGVLSHLSKDSTGAVARLEKAAALNPADPFNYLLLSEIYNSQYDVMAQEYKAAAAGPGKDELLKKSLAQMDKVIDAYARTLALSEGNEKLKAAREQIMSDLQAYYKYRHNNSTDGLQQLIDKYKQPAATTTPKP